MDQEPIHQPHDKLFKAAFSHPPTSAAFLKNLFSPPISKAIDWTQLSLVPGSFIDSDMRHSESDLLFKAPFLDTHSNTNFYVLFEHQSTEDSSIALRLLRYMVHIWEKHKRDFPNTPLPIIFPVVLCQNDRPWPIESTFEALYDMPENLKEILQGKIVNYVFSLLQLAEMPFDKIYGTPRGIVTLRTLKAARSGELLSDWVWDEKQLKLLPGGMLECLLSYLLNADLDPEHLKRKVSMLNEPELRTIVMTYAQQLHQEGRIEGEIKGLQTAIVATLEFRFGGIPDGLSEAIASVKELERLYALQRLSLYCATMDEFAIGL